LRETDQKEKPGFPDESLAEAQPPAAGLLIREVRIRLPTRHNPMLQQVVEKVNSHPRLHAMWRAANVNAVDRLGMSDHGPVHVQIVANIALKLLRLLIDSQIQPAIVKDYGLSEGDSEVVVVLASLLHDIGMSVHRDDHEQYSLFLASPVLNELLEGVYSPSIGGIISSEVLHAIIAHRENGHPMTLEAGVVRVADALDMAKGRSRIPFEAGKVNIHSVSAASIEKVEITRGEEKPILIKVQMNNSAGIFQIDSLLKRKVRGSGLEPYVEVEAMVVGEEKKLIQIFRL
jgi:metal-dependent HD superfamily phosphatase/phosphodiesterase